MGSKVPPRTPIGAAAFDASKTSRLVEAAAWTERKQQQLGDRLPRNSRRRTLHHAIDSDGTLQKTAQIIRRITSERAPHERLASLPHAVLCECALDSLPLPHGSRESCQQAQLPTQCPTDQRGLRALRSQALEHFERAPGITVKPCIDEPEHIEAGIIRNGSKHSILIHGLVTGQ